MFLARPRRIKEEPLVLAREQLSQALAAEVAGQERAWAEAVEEALADVENVLRCHAVAEDAGGVLTEVDRTRPTLVRQANKLCQHHGDLLEQAKALRTAVQGAAKAFGSPADFLGPASAVPAATRVVAVPDFGALRRQAEEFLAGLQKQQDAETDLVLESVNTEIGVGD